ncbi:MULTISPECIES: hypothetical protein [Ramlibacter]|uniref:Uncharacterized protein n=1 Tax=Ramlibacter rhizophilus TaxID=1781167 RepID=A0A4Z0BKQ1_9BURK|nr:hypothetical protein [Ramlibacter rhizophilus]TFY98478.1 hypothetical protein EZ242_13110 [Ramlibacter rhizophilus]
MNILRITATQPHRKMAVSVQPLFSIKHDDPLPIYSKDNTRYDLHGQANVHFLLSSNKRSPVYLGNDLRTIRTSVKNIT